MTLPGFDLPPGWDQRVLFGQGRVADLGSELRRLGAERPAILCSWRRQRTSEFRALIQATGTALPSPLRVEPHVPVGLVEAAWATVQETRADLVLSFGGGSAVDLGKALVYLASYGRDAFDAGNFAAVLDDPPLRHVAVPTTYSGAEATHRFSVSEGREKREWVGPGVRPDVVILDPELTLSLTPKPTLTSAFTALGHCADGLVSPTRSPHTDALAERAAGVLIRTMPLVDRRPADSGVRAELAAAGYAAGVVLDQAGGALHHGLCQGLGARSGIPHGMANAILLPHTVRFNADVPGHGPVRFARAIGSAGPYDAAEALDRLGRDLRLPRRLREAGVFEEDLEPVAAWAVQVSPGGRRNMVVLTVETALALLRAAW